LFRPPDPLPFDENQHNTYEDTCECSRINEIVNGIGGKPVIIIRYNPDIIKNNGKQQNIPQNDKIDLLVNTIKKELIYTIYTELAGHKNPLPAFSGGYHL